MAVRLHKTKNKNLKKGEHPWWTITIGSRDKRVEFQRQGPETLIREIEAELKMKVSSGQAGKTEPRSGKVGEKLKQYVVAFLKDYKHDVAKGTHEDCKTTINNILLPRLGNCYLPELTTSRMKELKADLSATGLKPVTINKHFSYISKFLKWCVEEDLILEVPCRFPRYARKKVTADSVVPLTRDEVNLVYEQIKPQYKLIFLSMSDMGLRRHEAMGLARSNVDLSNGQIVFRGKGNKERRVPYITERFWSEVKKACETVTSGPLTVNPQTKKEYYSLRKELVRAARAAGIDRDVDHHLLRHSFASWLAIRGYNPHVVQQIMGHESFETTQKIYTNVGQDFVGEHVKDMRTAEPEKGRKTAGFTPKMIGKTEEKSEIRTVRILRRVK